MCGKFVYKDSETIEYMKNQLTFLEIYKLHGQITRQFQERAYQCIYKLHKLYHIYTKI